MNFASFPFLAFFAAVFLIHWLLPSRLRLYWLLAGSYFFYGYWGPYFLGLLILTTLVEFVCALQIEKHQNANHVERARTVLFVGLGINILTLCSFKFFGLFENLLSQLNSQNRFGAIHAVIPIGISFYTFQSMGYLIDVYRRVIPASRNVFEYGLFVSFFPQLIAGPIERAGDLLPELKRQRSLSAAEAFEAIALIIWGLYLKLVVADNLRPFVELYFDFASPTGFNLVILSTYAGVIQLYCDFAGYCYMALGLGGLLGVRLSQNFQFPLLSENPRDFWRRWNITLVAWFRSYLYIPLANQLGRNLSARTASLIAITVTFVVFGFWHGPNVTYLLWGAFNATIYLLYRWLTQRGGNPTRHPLIRGLNIFLWFNVLSLGGFLLRSPHLSDVLIHFQNLFAPAVDGTGPLLKTLALFFGPVAMVEIYHKYWNRELFFRGSPEVLRLAFIMMLFISILVFGSRDSINFIYFQF